MKQRKSYTIQDFYKYYLEETKDNSLYKVDYKLYRTIVSELFKDIRNKLIEEGEEIKLPSRLGEISIVKTKPKYWDGKHCSIDFQSTKKLGKLVLYLNEHSDGFKYRLHWYKKKALVPFKSKYQIVLTRENKRRLAQIIKNKERDYIELIWFTNS
ncbi:topoisomerase [uncultured phage cr118_1]|jgi:hypothetical protein|uniref:Topoisomerase n=1 Tax=uncultured phage cr118_1 TaxID=2772063 RepID=A0A7M1RVL2_9CAUD|nr:topoisomerase [uncultured phage cr118_1]QOR58368.1 topoisomerase [uncultured phage cr118_1]DAI23387.1 MAG TPA: hypothetical protein [Caudoviricetes sp.]